MMKSAIFCHYDMDNSEAAIHAYDGERVDIIAEIPLDHDEFKMYIVRTESGATLEAFEDELSELSEDAR